LSACATPRSNPPPEGGALRLPWGAVNIDYADADSENIFTEDALQATAAFLGSEYDDRLEAFNDIENDDILISQGTTALFTDRAYQPVQADTFSIAMRSIESLSRKNVSASIYYIWSAGEEELRELSEDS
jgi:hypothetical protein